MPLYRVSIKNPRELRKSDGLPPIETFELFEANHEEATAKAAKDPRCQRPGGEVSVSRIEHSGSTRGSEFGESPEENQQKRGAYNRNNSPGVVR